MHAAPLSLLGGCWLQAQMGGSYYSMKIDYLVSFFVIFPVWRAVAKLLNMVS